MSTRREGVKVRIKGEFINISSKFAIESITTPLPLILLNKDSLSPSNLH